MQNANFILLNRKYTELECFVSFNLTDYEKRSSARQSKLLIDTSFPHSHTFYHRFFMNYLRIARQKNEYNYQIHSFSSCEGLHRRLPRCTSAGLEMEGWRGGGGTGTHCSQLHNH